MGYSCTTVRNYYSSPKTEFVVPLALLRQHRRARHGADLRNKIVPIPHERRELCLEIPVQHGFSPPGDDHQFVFETNCLGFSDHDPLHGMGKIVHPVAGAFHNVEEIFFLFLARTTDTNLLLAAICRSITRCTGIHSPPVYFLPIYESSTSAPRYTSAGCSLCPLQSRNMKLQEKIMKMI